MPLGVEVGIDTTHKSESTQQAIQGRVLIADDSSSNRLLLRHQLEQLGLEVTTAQDGCQVLEAAKMAVFDLILMDLSMPNMGGMDALRALRELKITTPVVALSGRGEEEGKEVCLAAGFNEFWEKKGYTEEQLFELLVPFFHCVDQFDSNIHLSSDPPIQANDQLFNLESLMQAYGNEEGVRQMLAVFVDDASKTMAALINAFDGGHYDCVTSLAHKLAGAASMIQAQQLAQLASQLEADAVSADKILIIRRLSRVQMAYEALCQAIDR